MNLHGKQSRRGFTLVELLLVLAIAGLLMTAVGGFINSALRTQAAVSERNDINRQARFAMDRMLTAVRGTRRLLLPLAENPGTAWSESLRDPGVLAVTLDPTLDRDADGFADADNDKDGAVDEDPGGDLTNDNEAGIRGVDDDGDGVVTTGVGNAMDDDEDGSAQEDPWDGVDNDGDGAVDEDPHGDTNNDNASGVAGVDEDGDGSVDEDHFQDEDEDGTMNEDWLDPVVYFLNGTDLVERLPNLNSLDGTDYTETTVAENVTSFVVERVPRARAVLVDISLEVTGPSGESVSLHTMVSVGGGW
jgi:prepilin-type N-terminal cleavage/methylation domain-containing protein